jgi:lantibiotic modifying enzyme
LRSQLANRKRTLNASTQGPACCWPFSMFSPLQTCTVKISSGAASTPVVLDLETLLNENVPALARVLGLATDDARLDDQPSVLSTGFLPQWQTTPDGRRLDMSALGADETQDPCIRVITWTAINTDQMTCSEEPSAPISITHRAQLAGALTSVADHLQAFLKGFKEMYWCLLVNREALLANEAMLNGFDRLELRVLLRDSETYARLHLHLLHPEFLKDGIDRSIELEWLARPLSGTTRPQQGRIRLYEAERTAMESLDIPHFSMSAWCEMGHTADDPDLWLLGAERDSRVLRRRLASLSPADCSRQLAAIEDAVLSRFNVLNVGGSMNVSP